MAIDLEKAAENFKKALENITDEEIEKYFPKDNTPKGWVSVEDKLPMMFAADIMQGYTEYKVKFADGNEGITRVSDHTSWYYFVAKEAGITHWYNE